jgi:hypothetical protein
MLSPALLLPTTYFLYLKPKGTIVNQSDDYGKEIEMIKRRLTDSGIRMTSIETSIKENTDLTKEIKEILDLAKSFFTVLGYLGKGIKWIAGIAAAAGAIWALFHPNSPLDK